MHQYETPNIKRRPDGSIDTAYYMAIGRQRRAEQAHTLVKEMLPKPKFFSLHLWPLRVFRAQYR